jgi:Mor family transcriptional regulator
MKVDYAELLSDDGMFDVFLKSCTVERNETLGLLFESIKSGLEQHHCFSEKLRASIFISICETLGGSQIYMPRGDYLRDSLIRFSIFKEFDGNNAKLLAVKYGMSVRSIQTILDNQRKQNRLARDCIERLGVNRA